MKVLSILFLISLLFGQIGGISLYPGVVIYIHDLILAVLFVEGFIQYAMSSKFTRPTLTTPIVLFVSVAVLSLLTNSGRFAIPDLEVSALYLVRWVFYAGLYILIRQVYTKAELWLHGLYSVGVGVAVLGVLQFFLYPNLRNLSYLGWDPHYWRLFSTFLDPNFAGIFLVLTLLLGLYLWQDKKTRLWVALGEVIGLVSLLLTYSRSSFLAFIAGLITIAIVKKQWLIIAGVAVFVGIIFFFPKTPGSTLNLLRVDSSLARFGNWKEGITLISQEPVLGHGFNTLRYLSPGGGNVISKAAAGLDSSILFVGATTGVVGLLAYSYLLYSMLRIGRKNVMYLACLAALGIHSLFVNSAFYSWVIIWFWILTGVVEKVSDGK